MVGSVGWTAMLIGMLGLLGADDPKAPDLAGDWRGPIQISPGVELAAVIHVTAEGEKLKLTFDTPEQKAFGFEADEVSLVDGVVKFAIKKVAGSYEGKVGTKGDTIEGTWKQNGKEFPLIFTKGATAPEVPAALKGAWEGAIELPGGVELRAVIKVEPSKEDEKRLEAMFYSPDQSPDGIPVTRVELKDKAVKIVVGVIGGTFEGTLDDKGDAMTGKWKQGQGSFTLNLKKTDKPSTTARVRPQDPKGPLPYTAEDLTFENKEAGITLAGTLTIPEGKGPFPAAVLVTGSGPQDRDESLLGHRPFLVLADSLTRRGIAVLRFDDRGVGKSKGDFKTATTADFATDAVAAVRYLKTRKEIAGDKIGVIGHSEGGLIAPVAAVSAPQDIAYIVLMAGPGVPGVEIIERQQALIAKAAGASDSVVEWNGKLMREAVRLIGEGAKPEEIKAHFSSAIKGLQSGLTDKEKEETKEALEAIAIDLQIEELLSPWFKYFLTFDPRPGLSKVQCPVLAINGEKDLQVDPGQNLPEVEKALKAGGNGKYKIVEMKGLNHLFQQSETGAPSEYGKIETTIDPAALDAIGLWVVETVGAE
jgi:uncharacterized protein